MQAALKSNPTVAPASAASRGSSVRCAAAAPAKFLYKSGAPRARPGPTRCARCVRRALRAARCWPPRAVRPAVPAPARRTRRE
jgi:hypothetical protein